MEATAWTGLNAQGSGVAMCGSRIAADMLSQFRMRLTLG
jgi:hypothetical protein